MKFDQINSPIPSRNPIFPSNIDESLKESPPTPTPSIAPPIPQAIHSDIQSPSQTQIIPPSPSPRTGIPLAGKPNLFAFFNQKKFIIYGGILALIFAIFLLISKIIIPALNSQKQIKTINYWGLWEDNSVLAEIITEFESKNPGVKINYKKNNKIDYRTRLAGRLAKDSQEEEVPDIFRIHQSWLPMFTDYLSPLPTDSVNRIGLETDYFDVYKNELKISNRWYAVPLMYDGLALYYNQDLIDASQVSLPKTWWELEDSAKKLTVRDETGKITISGVSMGLVDNIDHWSDIAGLMMKQNNINPLALNDQSTQKKLLALLTFYTNFKKNNIWNESLPSSTEMFASGKLAFYFAPSWRVFNIKDLNPSLKYGITTVPQIQTLDNIPIDQITSDNNLTNINWSTYWVEAVNSKSKNKDIAFKFLEFLSSKESMEKMFTSASSLRDFGEIYPRKSMASLISSNTKLTPFTTSANTATSWYLCSRTFDDGINDEMSRYFGNAINSLVLGNTTSDNAIQDLTNGINQLKDKYQIK